MTIFHLFIEREAHRNRCKPHPSHLHTLSVLQRSQMSDLFIVAPQSWDECLRLPPVAVFSMRSPHGGHVT
jgi:hypothetical protein